MNKTLLTSLLFGFFVVTLAACSTPEEKAQKYYDKGMALLESDPAKAKLEFQNALQIKRTMTAAIYGMALAAEKQADWQASYMLLNKVLNDDPNHIEATVKLGQLYLAAGEVVKATEMADKAAQLDADNLNLLVLQASISMKERKFNEAIAKANAVLTRDPNNPDALMVLAAERFTAKDIPATIGHIDKALNFNNKNLIMHLFKIQVLDSESDVANVEKAFKALLEIFPDNHMVRTKLAEFYFNNNKKAEAEKELRLLVEKQPGLLEPKINLAKFLTATIDVNAGIKALEEMTAKQPDDYELSFYLIEIYQQQNKHEAADSLLNRIIKNAGDKPEGLKAKVQVASKLLQNNKKTEAVSLLNEILKSDAGQQDALLLRAGVAINEQRFEDAVLDLRTALREQPNFSQGLLMLAKAYELTGSTALAEESYAKAVEAGKSTSEYALAYARYLLGKNEYKRAEKILEDAMKRQADDVELIKLLAQIKLSAGDMQSAQLLADKLKGINSGNLSDLIEGSILARNNDYQGSLKAFMRAHEAAPEDLQPIYAIVRTHINHKKNKEATTFLDGLMQRLPNNYDLKLLAAQVAISNGDANKAQQIYRHAIETAPQRPMAYQQLAYLLLSKNDTSQAKDTVQLGLKTIPNSFDLKWTMAEIYQSVKDYQQALKIYEDLMNSNPDSLVALNNYVSIITDVETDMTKLKMAYQKAQKLKTSNVPEFIDTFAWISYHVGKFDEAETELQRAIKLMPQHPIFHYHLGKVYWAKGDKVKAKQMFEKVMKLDPEPSISADIKKLLSSV